MRKSAKPSLCSSRRFHGSRWQRALVWERWQGKRHATAAKALLCTFRTLLLEEWGWKKRTRLQQEQGPKVAWESPLEICGTQRRQFSYAPMLCRIATGICETYWKLLRHAIGRISRYAKMQPVIGRLELNMLRQWGCTGMQLLHAVG